MQFKIGESVCELSARRLKPFEDEMLLLQAYEITPQVIRGKTESDDRVDYLNKDYLIKKSKVEREIRAQGLVWAVKSIQDKLRAVNEEAANGMYQPAYRKVIVEFVQNLLDEEVLNYIWQRVRSSNVDIPKHVNFSYPAG